ncbi:hypothetical protein GE253_22580 [Niveispirillum sp. SYP-B3756]|uniref:hypothetical protein n=1 Tax=Niveispirillum sp. SYP-B3756 TaxID=2662178 RepID=UPI001290E07C|nr:hypothetical protein [Niveispirillum sp. SYP-B3756]MQP68107.1 hypothetical protein [Niveispirillum sp. SYP-B3756]
MIVTDQGRFRVPSAPGQRSLASNPPGLLKIRLLMQELGDRSHGGYFESAVRLEPPVQDQQQMVCQTLEVDYGGGEVGLDLHVVEAATDAGPGPMASVCLRVDPDGYRQEAGDNADICQGVARRPN